MFERLLIGTLQKYYVRIPVNEHSMRIFLFNYCLKITMRIYHYWSTIISNWQISFLSTFLFFNTLTITVAKPWQFCVSTYQTILCCIYACRNCLHSSRIWCSFVTDTIRLVFHLSGLLWILHNLTLSVLFHSALMLHIQLIQFGCHLLIHFVALKLDVESKFPHVNSSSCASKSNICR